MNSGYLSGRGLEFCRGCGSEKIISVLDLGNQPVANDLGRFESEVKPEYPLELSSCMNCGLGQIGEVLLPSQIFGDYPYLSSMSTNWLAHSQSFAISSTKNLDLDSSNWVLEIASNDGYLLEYFNELGVKTLGIEPAENVANLAREKGVETLSNFFGKKIAQEIKSERGYPKLVVANNVMAHVPDLEDFLSGLSEICGKSTLISVENPTMLNLINLGQFDTIYHEHFSYLSVHAVNIIVQKYGLELIGVDKLNTHGGSNRYWIGKSGFHKPAQDLKSMIELELMYGLMNEESHKKFRREVKQTIDGFYDWLDLNQNKRIIGYGAAAKGATFLNAAHVKKNQIEAVLDASFEKQNKFMPGSQIKILAPSKIEELEPNDILVLPWNIVTEVKSWVNTKLGNTVNVWTAVPVMRKH
jgi:hypothetical protein